MTTFLTPGPISANVDLAIGDIRINASDRDDCTVSIRPRDEATPADVRSAETALVHFSNNTVVVKTLKSWQRFTGPGKGDGAVIVEVNLPTGSSVIATTGVGLIHCEGELSDTSAKAGMGDIRLDRVGNLTAKTGVGDVTVDFIAADAKVTTGSGSLRLGVIKGTATIKNSNGTVEVAEAGRNLQVRNASGNITIGRAFSSVDATSAAGDVRISEVSTGAITVRCGAGAVEIGVRDGAAAWLDLSAKYGSVRNGLTAAQSPLDSEATVEVRARTGGGDITINRAAAA